jgi:hypothetical protein
MLPCIAATQAQIGNGFSWPGSAAVTIYVSPNGNDSWSGRLPQANKTNTDGPFQHFDKARQYVQSLDKSKLAQVTVLFRGGEYPVTQAVMFSTADSGSQRTEIVYANYPGETPIITGGMRVTGWVNVGGNKWQTTLPADTAYFENLFYNGSRRLRPRVGGYLGQYFRVAKTIYVDAGDPTKTKYCPYVSSDTKGPNVGKYECFDRFGYDDASADANNPYAVPWANLAPAGGNQCGAKKGDPNLFGDIEVLVFEQFSTSKLPVSCVDTTNHIVYLTGSTAAPPPPHASETGFIETNRYLVENVSNALTQPGQWYLDRTASPWTLTYLAQAGEDPTHAEIVVPQAPQVLVATDLHYVTFRGLTFQHDDFTVPYPTGYKSTELEPDSTAAVSFQNSTNITFDSNTVRQTAGTGLDLISCITDPASDTDGSEAPNAECVAPTASPAVTDNLIANNAVYDIGVQGIRVGLHYVATDEDTNVPQYNLVENNVVEGYGRTIPAAFGIGQGYGNHNLYTHNDVYDGYHCAISLSTNAGDVNKPNGMGVAYNTISFNHVWNLLQGIMNDGGAIRVDGGVKEYTAPGNKIWNNKIHDVTDASIMDANGYGGHGIYMDNQTGLVDVENNLVYRVSDSTIYTVHGPQQVNNANLIKNNILAYGRLGMVEEGAAYPYGVPTSPANMPQAFVLTNNIFFFDRNASSTSPFQGVATAAPFYLNTGCAYSPFAFPLFQEYDSNLYWRTDGGFANYVGGFNVQTTPDNSRANAPCAGSRNTNASYYAFYDFAQWQTNANEDLHSAVRNPHFLAPFYPFDNYTLLSWPGVGFVPFDPNEDGRYPSFFNLPAPRVPATFVTMNYNPATDF